MAGSAVGVDHIAVGVQNQGVGVVQVVGQIAVVLHGVSVVLGVLVLGAVHGDILLLGVSGHLALDGLSQVDGLDLLVGHSDQDIVLIGVAVQVIKVIGGQSGILDVHEGLVQNVQLQLLVVLVVVAVNLSHIGVDDSDDHVVGVIVDEHLGGGALLDDILAGVIVVVLDDVVAQIHLLSHAVHDHGEVGVAVLQVVVDVAAHQIVQVLLLDGGGVNSVSVVSVGADLLVLIGPLHGRTAEVVVRAVGLDQVAVVQILTQLDGVLAVHLGVVDLGVLAVGAGAGIIGSLAAGDDDVTHLHVAAVLLSLDQISLQGVQDHLSHVVAGQGLLGAGGNAVEQTGGAAVLGGLHQPVRAEVGAVLEVAQGLQQHQGSLTGGDSVAAAVGLGVVAAGDAVGVAGGHIGLSPLGHVGEGAGALVAGHSVVQQVAHHNRHLVTGDLGLGIELAVLIADHDADGLQDLNGFLVLLGSHIGIARGAAAHHHQTRDHGRGEAQAESTLQVSHWNSSLIFSSCGGGSSSSRNKVESPNYWVKNTND